VSDAIAQAQFTAKDGTAITRLSRQMRSSSCRIRATQAMPLSAAALDFVIG
jgi:hypothetical protein